jgi:tRNA(fMet)-specific endonuclease VapC
MKYYTAVGVYRPLDAKSLCGSIVQDSVLPLPIFSYDLKAAQWHAQERARLTKIGKTPAFADGQIGSIAYCNGLILVTNDVADFQGFEGLQVENWFVADGDRGV